MLRVFPIATTSAETVPSFTDEWDGRSNPITADEGAPIVAVDEGHVYNDALTRTVRLRAFDGTLYDYGMLDGVRDRQVHVGETIGHVDRMRVVHFAVYPPQAKAPANAHSMLGAAPNLFIPQEPKWRAAAKMAALAAAGLGVGAVLAAVYYRTVQETSPRPQLAAQPAPRPKKRKIKRVRVAPKKPVTHEQPAASVDSRSTATGATAGNAPDPEPEAAKADESLDGGAVLSVGARDAVVGSQPGSG